MNSEQEKNLIEHMNKLSEHMNKLSEHMNKLSEHMDVKFNDMDAKFNDMDARFNEVQQKQNEFHNAVQTRINVLDANFNKAEQIFHNVDEQIQNLDRKLSAQGEFFEGIKHFPGVKRININSHMDYGAGHYSTAGITGVALGLCADVSCTPPGYISPIMVTIYQWKCTSTSQRLFFKDDILLTGICGITLREAAANALGAIMTFIQNVTRDGTHLEKLVFVTLLEKFSQSTFLIHVAPSTLVKDGPSAGLAFFVAIFSALIDMAPAQKIAFTGEIDPKGKVNHVGRIEEKLQVVSQNKSIVEKVYMPISNVPESFDDAQLIGVTEITMTFLNELFPALV